MDVSEFLLARISEDEATATNSKADAASGKTLGIPSSWMTGVADRFLAECEAKRRIIALHQSWPVLVERTPPAESLTSDLAHMTFSMSRQIMWLTEQEYRARFGDEPPTAPMLAAMATVYADHPDYDPAWRTT